MHHFLLNLAALFKARMTLLLKFFRFEKLLQPTCVNFFLLLTSMPIRSSDIVRPNQNGPACLCFHLCPASVLSGLSPLFLLFQIVNIEEMKRRIDIQEVDSLPLPERNKPSRALTDDMVRTVRYLHAFHSFLLQFVVKCYKFQWSLSSNGYIFIGTSLMKYNPRSVLWLLVVPKVPVF
jgi:hypothetical protein